MTDCELVRRMQQGDMQAFDTLYERYKDDAYRLACLITGRRTDGEDLAQEAFVAWCAVDRFTARRREIPAVAAPHAQPCGVEILPEGQTRNAGQ